MALTDSKPKNEIESKIIDTLEKIRPFLQRDGGDIAFDHYDDETGTVFIKVIGACMGCLYVGSQHCSNSRADSRRDERIWNHSISTQPIRWIS